MTRKHYLIPLLTAIVVVGMTPGVVLAAAPQPPASYYGQVLIDGEPAAEGVEITAYIDGAARGNITTKANGTFGGPGTFDEKLDVRGSSDDEGSIVAFEVGTSMANTTVQWTPGDHQELTLVVGTCGPLTSDLDAPRDLDGDGSFEDVNGNGRFDFNDVVALYQHKSKASAECHDYNGNGRIDFDDIVTLFLEI